MVLLEPMKKQPYDVITFPIPVILLIIGLTANVFIVAVNCIDRLKGREIMVLDKVVCSLAFSRICFQLATMLYVCKTIFTEDPLTPSVLYFMVDFCMCLFNFTNLWLATLLSVLFFLKIANYSHAAFLCMKIFISQKVLIFIISAVLMSAFKVLLFVWNDYSEGLFLNNSDHLTGNVTWNPMITKPKLVTFIVGNCGPLIIYWSSLVLLLVSLCRHMKKMRSADIGHATNHLDSYHIAIRSLAACFFIYGLHVGSNLLVMVYYLTLSVIAANILLNIFPTIHSAYFIYKTPRLKQQFSNMLQCLNTQAEQGVHM